MNGNKPFSAKDAKGREEKQMALARDPWVFFATLRVLRGSIFFNAEA
jgi:hypothetical protein